MVDHLCSQASGEAQSSHIPNGPTVYLCLILPLGSDFDWDCMVALSIALYSAVNSTMDAVLINIYIFYEVHIHKQNTHTHNSQTIKFWGKSLPFVLHGKVSLGVQNDQL